MTQGQDEQVQAEAIETTDQQPSSPAGSASSREERNARERLKKASITGLSQKAQDTDIATATNSTLQPDFADQGSTINNGIRGRPAKKRSFEDLAKDDADPDAAGGVAQPPLPKSGHHKRMRSRDMASGDHSQAYSKSQGDRNETSHEETGIDAQKSPGGPGVIVDVPSQEEMEEGSAASAPDRMTVSQEPTSTVPQSTSISAPTSGFANASTASPFGQTNSSTKQKSPEDNSTLTSNSAFASSGLSAFASSNKSPFDAAGSKSPSGFGSGQGSSGFGSSKGGFGGSTGFPSTGTSSFGGGGGGSSAFGTPRAFGGGFGAPKPFGASTGFGGSSGPSKFGTGKAFASSTKDEEEEEGGEEEDEADSSVANDDAKQDPRFHDQHGKRIFGWEGMKANAVPS